MKKDIYTFPAIITYDEDGTIIMFSDLEGCITCSYNQEDIFKMSKEALGLHLYGLESDEVLEGKSLIPLPTEINKIKINKNQEIILVDVYMPKIRKLFR